MIKQIARFPREITALKVRQWIDEWEKVAFAPKEHKRRPDEFFYLFSLSASYLKMLTGIERRTTKGKLKRASDLGIQRRHETERSTVIADYVRYGSPWSELTKHKRESGLFNDLRKPGWLPTAIVVNILAPGDKRRGQEVVRNDLITVKDNGTQLVEVKLPASFTGDGWKPERFPPIEVIDGQHRLWAFEQEQIDDTFELPVVAFRGLDIGWQAYLFVTINIKPKRINMSLAYDLYPLLRTEEWLQKFEGHPVYRETRAQELVEALWSHPKSPWCERINMLGEPGQKQQMVTQAAWIRSLMATFIKAWAKQAGVRVGGLFGAPVGSHKEVLSWDGAQQAAFLILAAQKLKTSIEGEKKGWAKNLRESAKDSQDDPAFYGDHSLLSTDQGIRGFLSIVNDLCYIRAQELDLASWLSEGNARPTDEEAVNDAIASLKKHEAASFLTEIASSLSKYDWRTSSAPDLEDEVRKRKAALRGSGGYRELRLELLDFLSEEKSEVGTAARRVLGRVR
jgi:DGQHR domain-containing protein